MLDMTSEKKLGFIERQARRANITPRQYCINQINNWREHLETVSDDYRHLDDEEFQKRLDEELQQKD